MALKRPFLGWNAVYAPYTKMLSASNLDKPKAIVFV